MGFWFIKILMVQCLFDALIFVIKSWTCILLFSTVLILMRTNMPRCHFEVQHVIINLYGLGLHEIFPMQVDYRSCLPFWTVFALHWGNSGLWLCVFSIKPYLWFLCWFPAVSHGSCGEDWAQWHPNLVIVWQRQRRLRKERLAFVYWKVWGFQSESCPRVRIDFWRLQSKDRRRPAWGKWRFYKPSYKFTSCGEKVVQECKGWRGSLVIVVHLKENYQLRPRYACLVSKT